MGLEQGSLISGGVGEGSNKRKFMLLYGDVLMLIIVWDKNNKRLSSEIHIMIMSFSNRSELWSWYIA